MMDVFIMGANVIAVLFPIGLAGLIAKNVRGRPYVATFAAIVTALNCYNLEFALWKLTGTPSFMQWPARLLGIA